MTPRKAGKRGTPERVVQLLQDEVKRTSQAATARATGLTLKGVQNYLKGIGEPTTATLEKLGAYFGVSVAWLRGEHTGHDLPIVTKDVHGGIDTWDTARGYAVHEAIQLIGVMETAAVVSEVLRLRTLTGYAARHVYEKDADGYCCVKMTGSIAITKGQNFEAMPINKITAGD